MGRFNGNRHITLVISVIYGNLKNQRTMTKHRTAFHLAHPYQKYKVPSAPFGGGLGEPQSGGSPDE